jgi:serine/threonine-protein kinase PknK
MAWTSRYRVLRRLGAGAAGGVYLVEDRVLGGSPIALKRVEAGSDPHFRDSLAREFAVLASLSLPRVARVYDLGFLPADGELPAGAYFTRAYVEGDPLSARFVALSPERRLATFASIVRTVALLHRAGVVHGDLKPGNVIVDEQGVPFLIDFGLSSRSVVDAAELRGSGSPLFMAPELLRGASPSVCADVYALGATLWTLMTERAPLEELGAAALSAKLRGELPSLPNDAAPALRAALEAALWAMAEDPRRRAPSADELLAKLETVPGLLPARGAGEPSAGETAFASPRTRGRETVLAELVERSSKASGKAALLLGASGMGKSKLLCELKWRLQLSRVRVIELGCAEGGLAPFAQLLRQLLLLEGASASLLSHVLAEIEEGRVERARLLKAVVAGLSERQGDAPLVLLVDDLDHAEPLFAEALRLAVHAEGSAALSVIASAEDAAARSVLELGSVQTLALAALPADEMKALVSDLLGPVEEAAENALLLRAAGSPGVLVEAAFALRDRPGFSAADVEGLSVGAIGERLSRARVLSLGQDEKRLLTVLSVVQHALPESVLGLLSDASPEAALSALQKAGLVSRERAQVTLRDPTLSGFLRAELAPAAQKVLCAALLAKAASALDPVLRAELSLLAEDDAGALALSEHAAQLLQTQGQNARAARLLEACLARATGARAEELHVALAELYAASGEAGRALAHAEPLLQNTELSHSATARALIAAASAQVATGRLDVAVSLLDRLSEGGAPAERAQATRVLSRVLLRQGKLARAREVVANGLAVAAPEDPALPELLAIDGTLLDLAGDRELALSSYDRAVALAEKLGLLRDAAQVRGYRAFSYEREGNLEKARDEYEACLTAAREAGDVGLTATYASNLGNITFRMGYANLAEQNFELAEKLARRAGRTATALLAANNLLHVHLYMGSYGRVQQLAEALRSEAHALGAEVNEAQATHMLAEVEARTRRSDAALSGYERAAQLFHKVGRPREAAEVLLDAAEFLIERGGISDISLASARLGAAREIIQQQNADDFRPRLRLLVGAVRAKNGDVEGALNDLEALEAQLDPSKHRPLLWQVAWSLSELHKTLGSDVLSAKKAREAVELLEAMASRVSRDARDAFRADPRRRKVFDAAQAGRREPSSSQGEGTLSFTQTGDPRLTRLLEILKRLARERDKTRLLERITDAAVDLSGAERGFVLLVDEQGQLCPHMVREGRGVEQDPHVAFSRSIAEAVLIDGEPIITVNARDDARVNEYMSVHKLMLKSVACIPINGPRGVTGVLYLEHRLRAGRFRDNDVDLLMAFADQAAIALENAELWQENERQKDELASTNRELLHAKDDIERLLAARTEELEQARRDLTKARAELETRYARHGIVGQSAAMKRVFAMVERVTDSSIPVVVQGESGTGKELVARAIHFGGMRKKGPFVAVNCAALPEQLVESELFGHVRGAFTGADRDRKGVFAQANGGTLFLDEFADTSPRVQIDLLRVLQEGKIRPVGADLDVPVDVRVIVAVNRPLEKLVTERVLREDLFYRLSVVEIRLPPLRERVEDIAPLCQHFLARIAEQNKTAPLAISREAIDRILESGLPGNVRQLEHLLTSAAMMAEGALIGPDDLPLEDRGSLPPEGDDLLDDERSSITSLRPVDLQGYKVREKERILEALDKHAWNRAKAATALGMPRRTFYRRLNEFGILGGE